MSEQSLHLSRCIIGAYAAEGARDEPLSGSRCPVDGAECASLSTVLEVIPRRTVLSAGGMSRAASDALRCAPSAPSASELTRKTAADTAAAAGLCLSAGRHSRDRPDTVGDQTLPTRHGWTRSTRYWVGSPTQPGSRASSASELPRHYYDTTPRHCHAHPNDVSKQTQPGSPGRDTLPAWRHVGVAGPGERGYWGRGRSAPAYRYLPLAAGPIRRHPHSLCSDAQLPLTTPPTRCRHVPTPDPRPVTRGLHLRRNENRPDRPERLGPPPRVTGSILPGPPRPHIVS